MTKVRVMPSDVWGMCGEGLRWAACLLGVDLVWFSHGRCLPSPLLPQLLPLVDFLRAELVRDASAKDEDGMRLRISAVSDNSDYTGEAGLFRWVVKVVYLWSGHPSCPPPIDCASPALSDWAGRPCSSV